MTDRETDRQTDLHKSLSQAQKDPHTKKRESLLCEDVEEKGRLFSRTKISLATPRHTRVHTQAKTDTDTDGDADAYEWKRTIHSEQKWKGRDTKF